MAQGAGGKARLPRLHDTKAANAATKGQRSVTKEAGTSGAAHSTPKQKTTPKKSSA